ncbi:MAG: class I SAM-dependent methyltransferase [Simkaniaceae bacterium]|nr:class I SAM-dependent methyltransferase [Candidatus Sacchlamyda saccharinae]
MWLYYFLKTKFFEWREQKAVNKCFYSHEFFREKDAALLSGYRGQSPYRISKEYLTLKGAKEVHQYGETPLTTMALIAKECDIGAEDTVIEMGAGRGRGALFLAEYVGCRVVAYEQIPAFVEKMVPSSKLKMTLQDMFGADFSKATAIYLYGTMLEDPQVVELTGQFPAGVKIISVSYPLNMYSQDFKTIKSFQGRFPWGKTEIYLNERLV